MNQIIAWAAREYRQRHPAHSPTVDYDMRPGDLRRCTGGEAESRLVLVQSVHKHHVVVCLLHSEPEWATEADLVLAPSPVTPWPVVVQTDLVSCAVLEQVEVLVARLPDGWQHQAAAGPALVGPLDARWAFKEREIDALHALTLRTWWELTDDYDAAPFNTLT